MEISIQEPGNSLIVFSHIIDAYFNYIPSSKSFQIKKNDHKFLLFIIDLNLIFFFQCSYRAYGKTWWRRWRITTRSGGNVGYGNRGGLRLSRTASRISLATSAKTTFSSICGSVLLLWRHNIYRNLRCFTCKYTALYFPYLKNFMLLIIFYEWRKLSYFVWIFKSWLLSLIFT